MWVLERIPLFVVETLSDGYADQRLAMCATERNPIELPHEDDNDAALGRQVEQVTPCRAAP